MPAKAAQTSSLNGLVKRRMKHDQIAKLIFLLTSFVGLLVMLFAPDAHVIQSGANGFQSGFEHPLTGPDHFLAMFAVGLWGAQMGGYPSGRFP